MGKLKNKDKEKEVQPVEETEEIIEEAEPPVSKKPIPSKLFIKNLKKELKDEKISESVFIAFQMTVKSSDLEENYRKIWKQTFKRS